MYPNNDDTLNVVTQNVAQPNENTNEVNNPQEGKKVNLKEVATFVAGGVAGAGASMAVNAFAGTQAEAEDPEVQNEGDEPVAVNPVEQPARASRVASAHQSAAQASAHPKPAEAEEPRYPNIHQTSNTTTTATAHTDEPAFYRENEVKIESIETHRTNDGNLVHTASGTVNGHEAHFIDDGHGNVHRYAVDLNDNNEIDENEVVHVENQGVTMGNLAEHMVDVEPAPAPTPTGNVQVLAVANDVEMGGRTVNVAAIAQGETTGVMIDANQNGEVDIIAVDANHDDNYSENEMEVVTDAHIPMPTSDDVSPDMGSNSMAAGGDLPDYSNDSDITVYDV
ncbi:MAG: hypothetical protein IJJ90_02060 [Prevotella sp.]|nr:hypothetical protein [Prevotella sp.]